MPNIPAAMFEELMSRAAPPEAPLPWNQPQSPIFDAFGVVGGTAEQERARSAAERNYDYAQAEAHRNARLAAPRFGGMDTPEALDKELFEPLRQRWSPPKTQKPTVAAAARTFHVGNQVVQQMPDGSFQSVFSAPAAPESKSVSVKMGDATQRFTPSEFSAFESEQRRVADLEMQKEKIAPLQKEYDKLKTKVAAGDVSFGLDVFGLTDRPKRLAELKAAILQAGFDPDTGQPAAAPAAAPPVQAAPQPAGGGGFMGTPGGANQFGGPSATPAGGNRKIVLDKSGRLTFAQ